MSCCCGGNTGTPGGVLLDGTLRGPGAAGSGSAASVPEAPPETLLASFAKLPWWAKVVLGIAVAGSVVWSYDEYKKHKGAE